MLHNLCVLAKRMQSPIKASCGRSTADVGFILDSSGSLRNEYDKEKQFLKQLAAAFGIKPTPDGSRAGVVTFSHRVEHR